MTAARAIGEAELRVAVNALEVAVAREEAAARSLATLLAILTRDGGYRTPSDQAALREARAVLAERTT